MNKILKGIVFIIKKYIVHVMAIIVILNVYELIKEEYMINNDYILFPRYIISALRSNKSHAMVDSIKHLSTVGIHYPFSDKGEDNEIYWLKEGEQMDYYRRNGKNEDLEHDANLNYIKQLARNHIAFPPAHLRLSMPLRRQIPPCDFTHLNYIKKKSFFYSYEEFKTTQILLNNMAWSERNTVNILTSSTNNSSDIGIDVEVSVASEDSVSHIFIDDTQDKSMTHKCIHILNVRDSRDSCAVYTVNVTFPAQATYYEGLMIQSREAHTIKGDLKNISFDRFEIEVGRGAIVLQNINANAIHLVTLNGIISGSYHPKESLDSMCLRGSTNIQLTPETNHVKSSISTLDGPTKVIVDGGFSKGQFITHCIDCQPEVISKVNQDDVHLVSPSDIKSTRVGYFKEDTSSHIYLYSKSGEVKIVYV
ncbi:hypothetical protein BDB01DRAFT_904292 [Pilobolus umbonatus]|nr:hypothetical protein BDB01DRAFT_904292 [Pilobolus umbonatus]